MSGFTIFKKAVFILLLGSVSLTLGQDSQVDHSSVHEDSRSLRHLQNLFAIHGVPKNLVSDDPITILVNHGYLVGFSAKHNQPRWAAYQVSSAKRDVDYERFPIFVDDLRLPTENRIGNETFGSGFDRGHMVPNAATNRQYAKFAQMETFLMSNISPQKANLNQGLWKRLEANILGKYPISATNESKRHVWVIVGPIFSDNPAVITRPNGTKVTIPESYFCILARPKRSGGEEPGNSDYLALRFTQNLPMNQQLTATFLQSINEIERISGLNFFPEFSDLMEERIEKNPAPALW